MAFLSFLELEKAPSLGSCHWRVRIPFGRRREDPWKPGDLPVSTTSTIDACEEQERCPHAVNVLKTIVNIRMDIYRTHPEIFCHPRVGDAFFM
jgi:hypothetical protein